MLPKSIQAGDASVVVRQAKIDEIIPLRHRVLRAGLPIEEAHFAGDAEATTKHVAAFYGVDAVCCASFVLNAWEGEPAWQLRGMATDAAWQSKGLGQAVLDYAMELACESSPVRLFWGNARIGALAFYRRHGWEIRSEVFDIPTAGFHHKMTRRVISR